MTKKKRIVLCADDFALNNATCEAIISLIDQQKCLATSCLVNNHHFKMQSKKLLGYTSSCDIGLHINLTEGKALSQAWQKKYNTHFFSLKKLLWLIHSRQIILDIVLAELKAQLDRFCEHIGRLPDFIDGHQHVHQFPIIRDAILLLHQQCLPFSCPIRNCQTPWFSLAPHIKNLAIQITGAQVFKKELIKAAILHNTSLLGVYHFKQPISYRRQFKKWLPIAPNKSLIMCHPAFLHTKSHDGIAKARFNEYGYFKDETFVNDLREENIQLCRFSQLHGHLNEWTST